MIDDIALVKQYYRNEANQSFYKFRQIISGIQKQKLKKAWFTKDISDELQGFYDLLVAGKKPILLIQTPPQHGKSRAVVEFIAWLSGKHPETRTIYASFSDTLGIRANRDLQRIFDSEIYKTCFPDTKIGGSNVVTQYGKAMRNSELIEFVGESGGFRNTTVQGRITGETLDLGVIDDPIKGRADANSTTTRNRTWDWLMDDFYSRFDEDAGLLAIATAWHIDDPISRMIKSFPDAKLLRYEAIATSESTHRNVGDALFPEHKSLEFLENRRKKMDASSWESLYQQNPIISGGEMVKRSWIERYSVLPGAFIKIVQSWDTAYKDKEINDPSVCTTWLQTKVGHYLVDVFVLKADYPAVKRAIRSKVEQFRSNVVLIEDKSSGQSLIQELRATGMSVIAIMPKGDKVTRMSTASDEFASGRVFLPENAPWLADYEAELHAFPASKHDDQVDSTSQYLNWAKKPQEILIG